MTPRPSLAKSFASALNYAAEQRGWIAFVPYVVLASVGLGAYAAWSVPEAFWSDGKWDVSATVYGGVLAFNAILLAVSGNAFAKIYEIITGPTVGPVIRKHGLLEEHLAFVDVNQLTLVAAALASLAGLITVLLPVLVWVDRSLLAATFSLSAYSLVRTMQASKMMHELIWEQAHLGDESSEPQPRLRPVENGR
jgi:hypothetical protein